MTTRRLKRSSQDKMLFGVAGGIAEYFDIDPVLVRVGFVLLTFVNLLGLIGYVILATVTPKSEVSVPDAGDTARQNISDMPGELASAGRRAGEQLRSHAYGGARWLLIAGAVLIVTGVWFLLVNFGIRSIFLAAFWPMALIVAGGLLLLLALRRGSK